MVSQYMRIMMKVTFIGQHCSKCLTSMVSLNSVSAPMRETCCDLCLVNGGPKTCPDLTAMNREPGAPPVYLPSSCGTHSQLDPGCHI